MRAIVAVLFVLITGCTVEDDRPQTLSYITEAILAPSCGVAECHSAMTRQSGYAFDSVAGARKAIMDGQLIALCTTDPPCDDVDTNSYLLTVITTKDTEGHRMPLDQPLANKNIDLIANWIAYGAVGYVAPPPMTGN